MLFSCGLPFSNDGHEYGYGGTVAAGMRGLRPGAQHPANLERLHRTIMREPSNESHCVPAGAFPEAGTGKCALRGSFFVVESINRVFTFVG